MNELLQKHGCSNVFTLPEGLKELMADISREVLRAQPKDIFDFIANYLSALLITREHGLMAVKILEELCDCRPSVSEHLIALGMEKSTASTLAQIMKDEFECSDASLEKERIKESDILKKILAKITLEEDMAAKVCQIARNAYKDYVYRKTLMEQDTAMQSEEPWQIAAERTLALYKKTKPSLDELNRATERIQAAYRGYHVRRNLLKHLKPKKKRSGPKVALPGPPLDIAGSREIDLGQVIDIKVYEDDVNAMFSEHTAVKLGLHYDPKLALTNVVDDGSVDDDDDQTDQKSTSQSVPSYLRVRPDASVNPEIHVVQVDSYKRGGKDSPRGQGVRRQGYGYRDVHDSDDQVSRDEYKMVEQRTVGTPARKISFSTVAPELIPNDYSDDDQDMHDTIEEVLDDAGSDTYQEVPEDIPNNMDGRADDVQVSPVSSVSSLSSNDTADQGHYEVEEH